MWTDQKVSESFFKSSGALQLIIQNFSDEWAHEKEKYKAMSDEMDQTFAELTGY